MLLCMLFVYAAVHAAYIRSALCYVGARPLLYSAARLSSSVLRAAAPVLDGRGSFATANLPRGHTALSLLALRPFMRSAVLLGRFVPRSATDSSTLCRSTSLVLSAFGRSAARRDQRSPALDHSSAILSMLLFIFSSMHAVTCPFIHSPIISLIHSIAHSFIHSCHVHII